MIKHAMTMVTVAALAAAPTVAGAQATTTPPPTQEQPATCDCPIGDARGNLRDLAAFAPLGLLGAMAAAGGGGLFAVDPVPPMNLAVTDRRPDVDVSYPNVESARNTTPLKINDAIAIRPGNEPVSVDSLRGGIRAPNTGTPLPSVFLIGSGLVAIGCVTLIRSRG